MAPITDEQAKLGQEVVRTVREWGAGVSDTLGDLPKNAVGIVGDWVEVKRQELRIRCVAAARERLRARGIEPVAPNPKILLPLLEEAGNEDSNELQDLWARLLAVAMDPNRKSSVRQEFISIIKQMDPLDSLVLNEIRKNGNQGWNVTGSQVIAQALLCSHSEVLVSFRNLSKLGCIEFNDPNGPKVQPYLSPLGQIFMNTVGD